MLKALPSRLLDIVGGGPGVGGAAPTQPLAGGPATEPVTPILLGDLRNLPGNGQQSNLPLGPAVQPTPPVWPAPDVPPVGQAPVGSQPPTQWPQQPVPQQTAPQWPQEPVLQQPAPQGPQLPVPQQPPTQFPVGQPQPPQNQCRCAGCCNGGTCCAPLDGALGTPGAGNRATGVAQVFGAIASIGLTLWDGIKSIIDAFRGRKKGQNPPTQLPVPAPAPLPFATGGGPASGAAAQRRGAQAAGKAPVDSRVVEAVAEANRTLATVAQTLEKLAARRATVRAGGPGQIVPPAAPVNPANPPVPAGKQQALAAIMAQLLALLATLTKLLEKLVTEQGAQPG